MISDRRQRKLYRDKLIKRDGADPLMRVLLAFLFSIVFSVVFFVVERTLANEFSPVGTGAVFGVAAGIFPVGVIMAILALRVRIKHALLWCFAAASFGGVLGLAMLGEDYVALCGGGFLCLAALLLTLFGPRYVTFRYAICPGCKYNLALLPKSDVCPECGRDNRDLAEAFRGVELKGG